MSRWADWAFSTEPIVAVQEFFGTGHPLPFRLLSLLGDTWGIVFVVGLALWLYGRDTMYSLIGIVSLGAAAKLLLTNLFDVPRPSGHEIAVYDRLEIGAFPSGHVFEAVGPWGQLYALGYLPLWVPALIAVLVALGRMYLGAHYLADVVSGIAFGAMFVWAYAMLWPHMLRWLRDRPPAFHRTLAGLAVGGTLVLMFATGGNPRRYEIYGMVFGGAIGLLLQPWVLPDTIDCRSWIARATEVLVGTFGIAAFLLLDRSQSDQALLLGTLTAGLATLWAIMIAPALLRYLTAE